MDLAPASHCWAGPPPANPPSMPTVPPPANPPSASSFDRVRGHASREVDGPYYEMFGSKREYERLVRGKIRTRRDWAYWRRQEERRR